MDTSDATSAATMNSRQRMLAAFEYTRPDHIPVVYHPSPAGIHVHGEKLIELFNQYPPDNPISFSKVLVPPSDTINASGEYHEIRTDEWGTEWEHKIFGIHGIPRLYPFESWDSARDYRFPPHPHVDAGEVATHREQFLVFSGWISIFEKLHALRPMDEVLMDIQDQDPDLMLFLDRLTEHWFAAIDAMVAAGVDVVVFGDDWGTQTGPIVSPRVFRQVFKPRYAALMERIERSGKKVFFHSCGLLGKVYDELLELGIHGLWPQIVPFEADPSYLQKGMDHRLAIYIHPDRQRLIPFGTPNEIEAKIRSYAERFQEGGGIFYVEIENDAPFDNVKTLVESIHRYR